MDNPYWERLGFQGRIEYSYTERFDYTWVRDPGEQGPPIPTTKVLESYATIDFAPNSGGWDYPGSGSGNVSIGGDSYSAHLTTSPGLDENGFPTCRVTSEYGTGTGQLWTEVQLTGESGYFEKTYTVLAIRTPSSSETSAARA